MQKEVYNLYLIGVGCSSQGMADVWGHPYSLLFKKKKKKKKSFLCADTIFLQNLPPTITLKLAKVEFMATILK